MRNYIFTTLFTESIELTATEDEIVKMYHTLSFFSKPFNIVFIHFGAGVCDRAEAGSLFGKI